MSYSIQCVHCKAVLKSSKPVPANKKVTCPKCKQAFTTPEEGHTTKFETKTALDASPPTPPEPAPESDGGLGDDLDAAIAKLQAEQAGGKKPAAAPQPTIPNLEIPDSDDDLVEPDAEETPAPREARQVEETEERRDVDEEEPRQSRKKRHDDGEDDVPRRKRRRRDDEKDEDDDEPRPRRKRRREDEEDDEPRSRRKRRRKDEDDDDKPRSKTKSGSGMLLALVGGGILALLGCCGCGVGGYFLVGKGIGPPDVVGRWQNNPNDNALRAQISIEFRKDGTGEMGVMGFKTLFQYELRGSEMTWTTTHVEIDRGVMMPAGEVPRRKLVTRTGNILRIENLDGENRGKAGTYFKVD